MGRYWPLRHQRKSLKLKHFIENICSTEEYNRDCSYKKEARSLFKNGLAKAIYSNAAKAADAQIATTQGGG